MQEELEGLSSNYPDRFKVYYVLNQVWYLLSAAFLLRVTDFCNLYVKKA